LPAIAPETYNYRVRPRGFDKWEGIGWRRRSMFAALGLRGPLLDATAAESELLREHSEGARCAVEIGVFEGVGAAIVRRSMDPGGELVLIDPYDSGYLPGLNMARIVARRTVGRVDGATVRWIRALSSDAVREWRREIEFLRLDGEHTLEGVQRDWREWSRFVAVGGRVALHEDVAPVERLRSDPLAAADEIVPWVLAGHPGWELAARLDSTAILRRVSA